ncbi:MAG TPA: nucleoside deaminase [Candidatus Methylomirabilis sp.]|nr:nucleoside deaminase [Candidatus Methylomirabilis sp.]
MSDGAPARRKVIAWLLGGVAFLAGRGPFARAQQHAASDAAADRRWIEAAFAMRRLAESWGDQSYGAVVVLDGALVGEGPSRVVKLNDPDAHAEREAIRDAQTPLGRKDLDGAVLYSTSRPCRRCEGIAAEARIARMVYGADGSDAGRPKP